MKGTAYTKNGITHIVLKEDVLPDNVTELVMEAEEALNLRASREVVVILPSRKVKYIWNIDKETYIGPIKIDDRPIEEEEDDRPYGWWWRAM